MTTNETRTAVLDVAQEFLQTRGVNAFSFRDLADRVWIKSASVHYHFPTKMEFCRARIARHRREVASACTSIDAAGLDPSGRLSRYVGVFESTLAAGNRMCLCGMLASDHATLDPAVVSDLRRAIDEHEAWIAGVLADGRTAGQFAFAGSEHEEARTLFAALEGAILIARVCEEPGRFVSVAWRFINQLKARPAGWRLSSRGGGTPTRTNPSCGSSRQPPRGCRPPGRPAGWRASPRSTAWSG